MALRRSKAEWKFASTEYGAQSLQLIIRGAGRKQKWSAGSWGSLTPTMKVRQPRVEPSDTYIALLGRIDYFAQIIVLSYLISRRLSIHAIFCLPLLAFVCHL